MATVRRIRSNFFGMRARALYAKTSAEKRDGKRRSGEAGDGNPSHVQNAVKALAAEAVGKYALKFSWNDNHDLGFILAYLREVLSLHGMQLEKRLTARTRSIA